MKVIDQLLNRFTTYRLMLYYLIALLILAVGLGYFGYLQVKPLDILVSVTVILGVSLGVNYAIAKFFKAVTNIESVYITALILALIVTPSSQINDLLIISVIAMMAVASKYLLAYKKRHFFNPAAIAVVLAGYIFNVYASWWVGSTTLNIFVLLGGLLIVRKIRRFDQVVNFMATVIAGLILIMLMRGSTTEAIYKTLKLVTVDSSFLFFAFVMFTEPLTSPTTAKLQNIFAILVGILYITPQMKLNGINLAPEFALVIANIYSFIISPRFKFYLKLKQSIETAKNTMLYVFEKPTNLAFESGQFLEWTLPHSHPDDRGNRRYFSIASAPSENELMISVKFYDKPSTFKQTLGKLKPGEEIIASELGGDFVLPKNSSQKLCFIAGGIGVAPFRSIIKNLVDTDTKRDISLFYSNNTFQEIAFASLFTKAKQSIGLNTIYTLTDDKTVSTDWPGEKGFVNETMIKKYLPDYNERLFYISGPNAMVQALEKVLHNLNVPSRQIKTDYFPGY